MAEIALSRDDIMQQYLNCIVKYKGRIIFVDSVDEYCKVIFTYLETMKREIAPFNLTDFKVANNRIGMINHNGFVFYGERVPSRKMFIGLSRNNFNMVRLLAPTGRDYLNSRDALLSLKDAAIFNSMVNKYPSFTRCLELTENNKNIDAMAWDRQFAIDKQRNIYYRSNAVGKLPLGKDKESDIVFSKGYEYLSIVLEGNYEKTITITCK